MQYSLHWIFRLRFTGWNGWGGDNSEVEEEEVVGCRAEEAEWEVSGGEEVEEHRRGVRARVVYKRWGDPEVGGLVLCMWMN